MLRWHTTAKGTRVVLGRVREIRAGEWHQVEGEQAFVIAVGKPFRVDGNLKVYGYVDRERKVN